MPVAHAVQVAARVPGFVQMGVAAVQSAFDPEPSLPPQFGVVQEPVRLLQTCPVPHCEFSTHAMNSVPVLVAPLLVATTVSEPSGCATVGVQDQPRSPTVVVQTCVPLMVTVTVCPGTPVPVMVGSVFVVVVVPLAPGTGYVSVTVDVTHVPVIALQALPGQSVFSVATAHARHVSLAVSQIGVPPPQSESPMH